MKKTIIQLKTKKIILGAAFGLFSVGAYAQTNVFDDVIAMSPAHTSLKLALETANLDDDLQDPTMSFTVFAPTNQAFDDAVTALGLADINALLALPNLADILLYHVLDSEVPAMNVSNGLIATPMNTSNTLKFTVDGSNVFVNQAPISVVDLTTDNGVVHVLEVQTHAATAHRGSPGIASQRGVTRDNHHATCHRGGARVGARTAQSQGAATNLAERPGA